MSKVNVDIGRLTALASARRQANEAVVELMKQAHTKSQAVHAAIISVEKAEYALKHCRYSDDIAYAKKELAARKEELAEAKDASVKATETYKAAQAEFQNLARLTDRCADFARKAGLKVPELA